MKKKINFFTFSAIFLTCLTSNAGSSHWHGGWGWGYGPGYYSGLSGGPVIVADSDNAAPLAAMWTFGNIANTIANSATYRERTYSSRRLQKLQNQLEAKASRAEVLRNQLERADNEKDKQRLQKEIDRVDKEMNKIMRRMERQGG